MYVLRVFSRLRTFLVLTYGRRNVLVVEGNHGDDAHNNNNNHQGNNNKQQRQLQHAMMMQRSVITVMWHIRQLCSVYDCSVMYDYKIIIFLIKILAM